MTTKIEQTYAENTTGSGERRVEERQILALKTLSKLARQFSNRPDFGQLNELMVLTISGQFSAPNVCAMIRQPGTQSPVPLLYATGKFRNDSLLLSLELTDEHCEHFLKERGPTDVASLTGNAGTANLGFTFSECGVKLVVPMLHNDTLIGVIGIGSKVTGAGFDRSDVELLTTIISTITPFIASSFLFLEIAALNKWYLDILDSVRQGVFVFDKQYRLRKVNVNGFNILKTFRPQLVHISSLHRAPIGLVFPDNIFANWAKRIKRAVESLQNQYIENMVAVSGDSKRIYNVRIGRVRGSSVLETDLMITLDDITEEKESEHRLFELQKLADMGAMASSISHELNNFLGLILGGVEMSEIALKKNNLEKVENNLGKVKDSVGKMARFTDGLMDYTRLDAKKKLTSLNHVVTDVLTHVTAQKRFASVHVLSDLDPAISDLKLDSGQIAQLLLNMLNNAADAINEASREAGEIVIKTYVENGTAVLSISDNGTGIKPEIRDKLFKAGFTTKEQGHGHGLVTCGKIVDNHGIDVTVNTELGIGTTFTFRFPPESNS